MSIPVLCLQLSNEFALNLIGIIRVGQFTRASYLRHHKLLPVLYTKQQYLFSGLILLTKMTYLSKVSSKFTFGRVNLTWHNLEKDGHQ